MRPLTTRISKKICLHVLQSVGERKQNIVENRRLFIYLVSDSSSSNWSITADCVKPMLKFEQIQLMFVVVVGQILFSFSFLMRIPLPLMLKLLRLRYYSHSNLRYTSQRRQTGEREREKVTLFNRSIHIDRRRLTRALSMSRKRKREKKEIVVYRVGVTREREGSCDDDRPRG